MNMTLCELTRQRYFELFGEPRRAVHETYHWALPCDPPCNAVHVLLDCTVEPPHVWIFDPNPSQWDVVHAKIETAHDLDEMTRRVQGHQAATRWPAHRRN